MNRRKRICFITTIGGTIRSFLIGFSEYLIEKRNYDVTFISAYDEVLDSMQTETLHFIQVPMKRGVSLSGLWTIITLYNILKKNEFDVIQYATPNASFYTAIAAKLAKVNNRLYTQWGIRYMGYEGGIRRFIFKTLETIVCKFSTAIECESESLYNFSIAEGLYNIDKGCVIGKGSACGVDLKKNDITKREQWRKEIRAELNIPDESVVYGFAGRYGA